MTSEDEYEKAFWKSFEEALDDDLATEITRHGAAETGVRELAKDLTERIAQELAAIGPEGWTAMSATFALTVGEAAAEVVFTDGRQSVRIDPRAVLPLARELRELSARLIEGPWWRFHLRLSNQGRLETTFDYGDEPFPDLFPPEAYRADIAAHPRPSVPMWLAAYIGHGDRQRRDPREAFRRARADRAAKISPVHSTRDFPTPSATWARWALIASAFVAVGSEWGPRMGVSAGTFEGSKRGGSTLATLPGGRMVLSGGVWNDPALAAAYQAGGDLPDLFAGAPDWVADPVLNHRAAAGMLSFCYWSPDGERWYRGDSPPATGLSEAVPGVWTAETVVDMVAGLTGDNGDELHREAVALLFGAAEEAAVSRELLALAYGDDADIDGAHYELMLAGLVATAPVEEMSAEEAIVRVREHILGLGLDTRGYPLSELTADRFSVGHLVFVPTRPGEIAIGRALFYVGDDGVLEQSSSSIAPSRYIADFEKRYAERHGG
ncbi:hypothetical protein [Phytomonospora endophytica]|uniref:Uncharacterized protein n=1 Tax=Phytomonospora endophytica TaxID=714109 RepID=A0A841FJA2_9ACTN|nr:hypothetical protein [Phytomonospora endophytica]MBB6035954.1 hypothetical protein [Phytomonospora endophytica]GIG66860.1 hypothetical protein Pen01_31550 [Phytomonospora endophytica]